MLARILLVLVAAFVFTAVPGCKKEEPNTDQTIGQMVDDVEDAADDVDIEEELDEIEEAIDTEMAE